MRDHSTVGVDGVSSGVRDAIEVCGGTEKKQFGNIPPKIKNLTLTSSLTKILARDVIESWALCQMILLRDAMFSQQRSWLYFG